MTPLAKMYTLYNVCLDVIPSSSIARLSWDTSSITPMDVHTFIEMIQEIFEHKDIHVNVIRTVPGMIRVLKPEVGLEIKKSSENKVEDYYKTVLSQIAID